MYKNIRVPVGKSGKTRLQRVMVKANGQYKFVKNLKTGGSAKGTKTKRSTTKRTGKKVNTTGKGKMFRTLSGVGALEDIGVGFIGFTLLGKTPLALPITRTLQGLAGYALDRRGKNRAVSGILDLVTLWLAGGFGARTSRPQGQLGGTIIAELRNLAKIRPL